MHRSGGQLDAGLLVLRLGAGGFLLFNHGLQKLLKWGTLSQTFFDPFHIGSPASLALAVFAELGCSALIVLGLFTRPATIPILITMLVAAFGAHAHDPWAKKEFPLLYGVVFVTLLITGPGRHALDARLGRRRR